MFTSLRVRLRRRVLASRACRRSWLRSATLSTPLPASPSGICHSLRAGYSDNRALMNWEKKRPMADENDLQRQKEHGDAPPVPATNMQETPATSVARHEFEDSSPASPEFEQIY